MLTLAVVLVQSSWTTYCVVELRQGLWTVLMMGLETMTFALDIIMMMQECDANQVKGHVHKSVLVMIILNCLLCNLVVYK